MKRVGPATLLLSLFASVANPAQGSVAAPGGTGGEDIHVVHYDVEITPDFEQRSIAGRTRILFRSERNGVKDIRFSGNAMTIDRANSGGRSLPVSRDNDGLVVGLPGPLARGRTLSISIAYHGVPARGLVFGRRSVYTNYFACDWMFCGQDRPGDKATIDLTLVLPKGMTSVGVGLLRSIKAAEVGTEAHVWHEDRPYSSYVYGFAAGEFHVASQRRGTLELEQLSENASPERLSALFATTESMVRFFEERAGVALPHSRYTQVLVPGSVAQEAVSFSVIGDDAVSPIIEAPQEDWVVAHELAHQWWGNLVTCTDWGEFWLNEGITTFMVAAWKEHKWGRAAYDREMELARQRVATAKTAGVDVPLTYRGTYPSLSARRAITYSRGALFMDRLRQELGDQVFWRGLRAFTRAHAGGTVNSRDFQRAFEATSGRNLSPLFQDWVY